jgi:hypothetical protein
MLKTQQKLRQGEEPIHDTVNVQNVGKGERFILLFEINNYSKIQMELNHPTVKSDVFKHIETYEVDICFGSTCESDCFSLRIELFQSLNDKHFFRCKSWRTELFRIQSTFPQDQNGHNLHEPSDEEILVEFSIPPFGHYKDFYANNTKLAINKIIKDLRKMLENISDG